jgi:DNA-binding winged helix-turn-helix (wHTH) protein
MTIATFRHFKVDFSQRQLMRDDVVLHLTPKAFDLLAVLIEEVPRVVRKSELHERLWPSTFVSDATLVGLVKELRRALVDHDSSAPVIRTAHRIGYAFSAALDRKDSREPAVSRWIVAGNRRIELHAAENLIGRDPACTVWLDAPGVSRRHARIVVGAQNTMLEDLGSKNGTTLREALVTAPTVLHDGDRIRVGLAVVTYHASTSGMPTETVN